MFLILLIERMPFVSGPDRYLVACVHIIAYIVTEALWRAFMGKQMGWIRFNIKFMYMAEARKVAKLSSKLQDNKYNRASSNC